MRDKAMQILKDNVQYYYDTKYSKLSNYNDTRTAMAEMQAVYETLRDLKLVTSEDYRAMKHDIHEKMMTA